ncbi:MAG TPA: hypothetical protein VJ302_10165, partial [Blastocatellia bacterium]|nr:hypothetical protein [Blastocatellia bacterium]
PGVTLFIVLDHPESVFMRLLEKTAPMYYARSLNAHRTIEGLHEHGYRMEKTEFDTHLVNPLGLEDERRDAVLSLLCYRDFRALDSETRSWVGAVVSEHERSGQIVCKCVCYELMRG